MKEKLTHVILIGAMKCGTTTLYDYLTQHPMIAKCQIKEPEYFSRNLGNRFPKKVALKKLDYVDIFKLNKKKHLYTLDASTGYTKYPMEQGVAQRIHESGIRPKFLYIVRNPFDRIKSHYNFNLKDNFKNMAIDKPHLINTSKYNMQLNEYRKYFPKEAFKILEFQKLISDPIATCNEIFEFLNAPDFEVTRLDKISNKTKTPEHKMKKRILSIFKILPMSLSKKVVSLLDAPLERLFPGVKHDLSLEQRRNIHEVLLEDMQNFSAEYKVDVSGWGF